MSNLKVSKKFIRKMDKLLAEKFKKPGVVRLTKMMWRYYR